MFYLTETSCMISSHSFWIRLETKHYLPIICWKHVVKEINLFLSLLFTHAGKAMRQLKFFIGNCTICKLYFLMFILTVITWNFLLLLLLSLHLPQCNTIHQVISNIWVDLNIKLILPLWNFPIELNVFSFSRFLL